MKVKNWMITEVITASPEDTVEDAIQLMRRFSIRHLPIVENGKLVGLVTESNLRAYLSSEKLQLPLKEIMILNPITIDPETSIDEAARIIYKYKIGGLPVITEGKLVGIITITDILEAFIELMGLLKSSSRLDVIPKKDNLDEVLEIIRKGGGKIISIGMDVNLNGEKVYFIRLEKIALDKIASDLETLGHKVVSLVE
ncbi:putative signal transduction protein with CBS domains [Thermodesulfobacterium geofontis OPF15]|jgi:acetoin utilization protein AcuB|uniref:CBS domain-containing protein n=2 Tax=Thermodesulfobacterium geofontis TaxID=1295609 RepID=A0A7C4NVV5_9BACT|nr:CBS domain-containing protein [Thermodesulfobacterium geofontis]AEH22160.1 putative signal transduction protein with CBS domains [Thermodesulfobacterium geofontis OPF15]